MHSYLAEGVARLRATGTLVLRGSATRAPVVETVAIVLVVLIGGVLLHALALVAAFMEFGFLSVVQMLGGVIVLCVAGIVALAVVGTRSARLRASEAEPVVLDDRGLAMRGVGPLPWHALGPARISTWRGADGEARGRRGSVPLTGLGIQLVEGELTGRDWFRLRARVRPSWTGQPPAIDLPGVVGMSAREVAILVNAARDLHLGVALSAPDRGERLPSVADAYRFPTDEDA
ncbi:hypothetical protein ACPYO6_10555 [Georgenia sp. Z1344]|uniref:hypothetical protein n=1 Tax=Georgenia sp. Z1344 TaxID=3416706 RepID=UPI003CF9F444